MTNFSPKIETLFATIHEQDAALLEELYNTKPQDDTKPDPSMGLHNSKNGGVCPDPLCPCKTVVPEPALRTGCEILNLIGEDDEEFASAAGEGYLNFYDTRAPFDLGEITASSLYQFMTDRPEEYTEKWWCGYVCGFLLAMGESNPAFQWESADPPERQS